MSLTINDIQRHPVIPVVEIDRAENAVPLAEAIVEGGINIIEITLRTDAAIDAIDRIRKRVPTMLAGAGTVLTREQGKRVREAGAQFGVAPGLDQELVEDFKQYDMPFIPGVMTPSEFTQAHRLGCSMVKFFPAESAGGVKFLKAISGPFQSSGMTVCATGGVTLSNMQSYLDMPMVSAVGGS